MGTLSRNIPMSGLSFNLLYRVKVDVPFNVSEAWIKCYNFYKQYKVKITPFSDLALYYIAKRSNKYILFWAYWKLTKKHNND